MKNLPAVTCRLRFTHPQPQQPATIMFYGVIKSFTVLPIRATNKGLLSTSSCPTINCFYRILPSTRITILVPTGTAIQPQPSQESITTVAKTLLPPPLFPSPPSQAALVLAQTMHWLLHPTPTPHNHHYHAIPRTFSLSGPPGTGKTFAVTWAWRQ
jgi:hypothetical protein